MATALGVDAHQKRATFLRIIFEGHEGYVCVARILRRPTTDFQEAFFRIPDQYEEMAQTLQEWTPLYDVYFCPMLFTRPKRVKEAVGTCPLIWADLDSCHPDLLRLEPSISIQTSPGRYQALWRLVTDLAPVSAEDLSRRVAYAHEQEGADISGWDLTQLLRVPFTFNMKYMADSTEPALVSVVSTSAKVYTAEDFEAEYPPAVPPTDLPIPAGEDLPAHGEAKVLLGQYKLRLQANAGLLFTNEPRPDESWSHALWSLEMLLYEAGMTPAEVFVVAKEAACNKFARDGLADSYLWKDILRAHAKYEMLHKTVRDEDVHTPLLTDEERQSVSKSKTIVEEYIEWAQSLGDAAWEYHQAGAFVCLSSLLAGPIRLPTSFGTLVPNLWFMILADTTLTRKTTAMDIAMDMIVEIDSDAVLATDGSIEGLFSSLAARPGRPSIFLRDEFSGLLDMIARKDYYAGMAETLTKMYDGKFQKRVLKREVIEVRDPVLIMFTGGIKERILSLLTYEHIASGFLPRFVFISAESDVAKLRPLGPPTQEAIEKRFDIVRKFANIRNHYITTTSLTVNGKTSVSPKRWDAQLTQEAWDRYNAFEADMLRAGLNSFHRELVTPMFDRLSKTGLKLAVLCAAVRKLEDELVVDVEDILKAISYIEKWRVHSAMVVNSVDRTSTEKQVERIKKAIQERPGVLRSEIMQVFRLDARITETILSTLDQRGQLQRVRTGRTERLTVIA